MSNGIQSITEIEKNLAIATSIDRENIVFYDAAILPFQLYGVFVENGVYRRMPETISEKVSHGVNVLSRCSAGGRVRFITDSPYVAIKVEGKAIGKSSQTAFAGSCGFDMYSEYNGDVRYEATFLPPIDVTDGYESVKDFKQQILRTITINFPSYYEVYHLYIGLQGGSILYKAEDYQIKKPVVYYGSSITQGASASRPGNTYQNLLSRWFGCDYVNLGFSGGAKGEIEMAEYISTLEMSVLVLDYDYNAPTAEHLQNTHERMFEIVRKSHPNLPILIMPRPKYYLEPEDELFAEIVYKTYLTAKSNGDDMVWFVSGKKLMEMVSDTGTVDGCHPTDSGFFSMACAIKEVFIEIFKKGEIV